MGKFASALFLIVAVFVTGSAGQSPELKKIELNGLEIHYIEQGTGEALILLHGGLFDYRSWSLQMDDFAKKYRVISYSRRYSYPNKNSVDVRYRPAVSDAADLKGLIKALGLKKVHLVGLSYGAFTGLIFAVDNPNMVASMTLAEPPSHQLIRDLHGGEQMYQDFMLGLKPMVEAFKRDDDRDALVIFNRKMGRDFDKLPQAAAASMLQNAPALKAINLSSEPFPAISKESLRKLKIPTLMIKSERADRLHSAVTDELARLIPMAKSVVVPNSGHNAPRDNPGFFNSSVLKFLESTEVQK